MQTCGTRILRVFPRQRASCGDPRGGTPVPQAWGMVICATIFALLADSLHFEALSRRHGPSFLILSEGSITLGY
jgi:hypothetical protein